MSSLGATVSTLASTFSVQSTFYDSVGGSHHLSCSQTSTPKFSTNECILRVIPLSLSRVLPLAPGKCSLGVRRMQRVAGSHKKLCASSEQAGEGATWKQWKEVRDPTTGRAYYWDTLTNETTWTKPSGWGPSLNTTQGTVEEPSGSNQVGDDELVDILLSASAQNADRFGSIANKHRPRVFEDGFFDHITKRIRSAPDDDIREGLEKLQAKLANPLLKNPPPF